MAAQNQQRRLTVAMIVRDEEDVLARSIQSVHAIADEIVVLDTGSTDQTPTLAEQSGATLLRTSWNDDFSAARNHVLEQVTGDWVLWLDAGERLDAETAAELRDFVDHQTDPQCVYMLMVEIPPADPSGSSEQAAQLRLMPRHPELRFAGRVRETLQPAIETAGLYIDAAPGRILRHPRQHDNRRKAQRARRNLALLALESGGAEDTPARLLLAQGEAHSALDDWEAARDAFGQAIEASQRGSTEMLEGYYGLLTMFDEDATRQERQISVCLKALDIFPLDAQLLCAMGNYLQARNQLELAAETFRVAVTYGKIDPQTWHLSEIDALAAVCLNLTLQLLGNDDEARCVLEETLERCGDSVRLRRRLIDLHVKHERTEEAFRQVDAMPMTLDEREAMRNAIRGACAAAKQQWVAALGYLQSAYLAGSSEILCLRWLSVTLLSNGQGAAAEPVLRHWLRLEPNSLEAQKYLAAIYQSPQTDDVPSSEPSGQTDRQRLIRIDSPSELSGDAATHPLPGRPSDFHPMTPADSTTDAGG